MCRACPTAWRWKSFIQPDGGEGLVKRKAAAVKHSAHVDPGGAAADGVSGVEGSVEQSRDPTNRNRIRGLPGRTSGLATAKSSAISLRQRRKDRGIPVVDPAGSCADMNGCGIRSPGQKRLNLPREICVVSRQAGLRAPQDAPTAAQKSAEGIVGRATGRRPVRGGTTVNGPRKGLMEGASRTVVSCGSCGRISS